MSREIASTLNTSLGFGGANTCVVLTKARSSPTHDAARDFAAAWITGVGVVLPGAVGHAAFAERLTSEGPIGGAIDDASLSEWLNVRRARRLSNYVKYTLAAASMAVKLQYDQWKDRSDENYRAALPYGDSKLISASFDMTF